MIELTRSDIVELRRLRRRHIMHGIGSVSNVRAYKKLLREAEEFIMGLTDERERIVMEEIYLHGMTAIEASIKLYYSERQIRRIHARVLKKM